MKVVLHFLLAMGMSVLLATVAIAQNVDLSTVPNRDQVELTIYNSEDLTSVRDIRKVTFKKGNNPLQFSWAGTKIDSTSVHIRFLTQGEKLEVTETTFPHAKTQMLYWNVSSELDGEAIVEITYFTSGISWTADYVGIADTKEQFMDFEGYVRIHNQSGEEYENASVRLVVGTINLVEKIAQLAGVEVKELEELSKAKKDGLEDFAKRQYFFDSDGLGVPMGGGAMGGEAQRKKEVIKEGLSEYFIYSIEGTETIPSGWSKRLSSLEAKEVPINIEYRYRPQEYGDQLVRMYLLKNDEASHLGSTPLPDGTVRLFRDNGRDGLTFLLSQQTKYIPIGDKFELNLGADPEVIFELVKTRVYRDGLWLQIHGTNEHREIGGDGVAKIENASLVGWNDHELFEQRIRNYTSKPIQLEIRRPLPGHVVFRSKLAPTLHDYQTVELKSEVKAGEKKSLAYEVVRLQGISTKQNNVTLEESQVQQ